MLYGKTCTAMLYNYELLLINLFSVLECDTLKPAVNSEQEEKRERKHYGFQVKSENKLQTKKST